MNIQETLKKSIASILESLYGITEVKIDLTATRSEFPGDVTLLVFPYVKAARKAPEATAAEIGEALKNSLPDVVAGYNVVKGFLNIELSKNIFFAQFKAAYPQEKFGYVAPDENAPAVMVEYSSPNTNKPLHLGHIRNNLLGYYI